MFYRNIIYGRNKKKEKPMASDKIFEFTDAQFDADVLKSATPVLVDFWATWCAPCIAIAPVLEQLADEYDGKIKIGKVNVDENPATPGQYGVRGIPTMILFKEGQIVDQLVGAVPKKQVENLLQKAL
jgi:thioredoxin 1